MKTQNSNLTFEKDECAKEYEELGLKELKELMEADRMEEFFREPTAEERKAVVEDSPSLVKDLVKAFGEDGTWLERQGVYTLTLAEAKQRAVDIIESVLAKDEQTERSSE